MIPEIDPFALTRTFAALQVLKLGPTINVCPKSTNVVVRPCKRTCGPGGCDAYVISGIFGVVEKSNVTSALTVPSLLTNRVTAAFPKGVLSAAKSGIKPVVITASEGGPPPADCSSFRYLETNCFGRSGWIVAIVALGVGLIAILIFEKEKATNFFEAEGR